MVRIGLVGIGFMGRIHYLAAQRLKNAKVTAICSRDAAKRVGDWTNTRGNFGPEPGEVDLTGVKAYDSLEAMLADPDIDLIDICNPTIHHPETAIAALKAGKHVLVEKPIALTTADAGRMVEHAKVNGQMLMVAHVLPFIPEFAFAAETIHSGKYGKLRAGHLMRVIARPDWSDAVTDVAQTGGPAIDLHIHDTHFIGLVAGVPKGVSSTGLVEGEAVVYLDTQYHYGDGGPTITCASGAVASSGRPFAHGFELYLEEATLAFNSGGVPLTVFKNDGTAELPQLVGADDPIAAFVDELQAAVDAATSGQPAPILDAALARDALVLCDMECESVKSGEPKWF